MLITMFLFITRLWVIFIFFLFILISRFFTFPCIILIVK